MFVSTIYASSPPCPLEWKVNNLETPVADSILIQQHIEIALVNG